MVSSTRVVRLIGETMREIGILMLVFGPLDAALGERPARVTDIAIIALAALAMIIAGILLESE
jgi:hypothetical protein